jgi:DNA-directed RNA polymerase subunit RPC12/RpoP
MHIICDNCNKKYFEKDLEKLVKISRSEIQNIVTKKETDKEKFVKQNTLYKCISCGHALRGSKNERSRSETI